MGDHRGKLSSLKISVNRVVSKFRSALNGHSPQFLALSADPSVSRIIVEHRVRFALFLGEYLGAALAAQGRELVVEAPSELGDDLVRDIAEIQTSFFMSFCLWIYGKDAARNRTHRVIEIAVAPQGHDDA